MASEDVKDCIACGARRYRCNQARPKCSLCAQAGRECSYDWTLGPHIYHLFGQLDSFREHLKQIQDPSQNKRGGFGRVYKVALTRLGRTVWFREAGYDGEAAVKVMHDHAWNASKQLMHSLREAWTWSQLEHPNVAPFWGITDYRDIFPSAVPQICMISPWAQFGNAEVFFQPGQNENLKLPFLLEIARGLNYLHNGNNIPIVHGDLKAANILVAASPNGLSYRAQLTDFGLSRMALEMDTDTTTTTSMFAGNWRWLAWERMDPERFGLEHAFDSLSTASDIFELMRTFLQITTGKLPYHGQTDLQVQRAILMERNPERPTENCPHLTDNMWRLMVQSWSINRSDRCTLSAIMNFLELTIALQTTFPEYPTEVEFREGVEWVEALFDYQGQDRDAVTDLSFVTGQQFVVLVHNTPNWWTGRHNGKRGLFPSNRVKLLQWAEALWDYQGESVTDISFQAGQRFVVIKLNGSGWWTGQHKGKRGLFPSNRVKLL